MKNNEKFLIRIDRNDELNRPVSEVQISVEGTNFVDAIARIFSDESINNYIKNVDSLLLCIDRVDNSNQLLLFSE